MNNLVETVEKAAQSLVTWAVVAIAGGAVAVVRKVFTNQANIKQNQLANEAKIEALKMHLESRDEMRSRDREDLQEVKKEVKEIRNIVIGVFQEKK